LQLQFPFDIFLKVVIINKVVEKRGEKKIYKRFIKTLDKIFKSVIINFEVKKNLFKGTNPVDVSSKKSED